MSNYHITPGQNGYTQDAGKKIRAMNIRAEKIREQQQKEKQAEAFARHYLQDHPDIVPLTGFEIANQHLAER